MHIDTIGCGFSRMRACVVLATYRGTFKSPKGIPDGPTRSMSRGNVRINESLLVDISEGETFV